MVQWFQSKSERLLFSIYITFQMKLGHTAKKLVLKNKSNVLRLITGYIGVGISTRC